MTSYHLPPRWLEALSWASLAVAFAVAAAILLDVFVRGHRQKMAIMEIVYPVTALYWGPVTLWFYLRYGRRMSKRVVAERRDATGGGSVGPCSSRTRCRRPAPATGCSCSCP